MKIQRGVLHDSASLLMDLLRSTDLLIVGGTGYLAGCIYYRSWSIPEPYIYIIIIGLLATALIFSNISLYQVWHGKSLWEECRSISLAWGGIIIGLVILAFFSQHRDLMISRYWFGGWFVAGWLSLLTLRVGIRLAQRILRKNGLNQIRIIILGAGGLGQHVAEQLLSTSGSNLKIVAFFDDNPALHRKFINGIRVQGSLDGLTHFLENQGAEQVWFALPLKAEDRIKAMLYELRHSNVETRFIPNIFNFHLLSHSFTDVAGIPVINLNSSPISGFNRLIKGLEDRGLALLFFILLSPLMLGIAIGIKLSSRGPIIFRQKRHGWNGKYFEVWKFRSMKLHEEEPGVVSQASTSDPRITRFGQFLRGTSLDELPQLINVLQGRMSIVGPRPHAVEHNEIYKDLIPHYMRRHDVKPGITGWAQINGWRGETETLYKMKRRIEYDLFYIQHWSLSFDLRIIFMTVFKGFLNKEIEVFFHGKKKDPKVLRIDFEGGKSLLPEAPPAQKDGQQESTLREDNSTVKPFPRKKIRK